MTLAAVLLLFSTFIYLTTSNRLNAEVDRGLLAIAEAVASPTLEPFRSRAPAIIDQILEDFIGPKVADKYVQIADANGNVIARSKNLLSFSLPLRKSVRMMAGMGETSYQTHKGLNHYPLRVITIPVINNGQLLQVVQVGTLLNYTTDILDELLLAFAVSIPLSLLLLWYGGWFLAGRALKPVEIITASARTISADNLGQRLEVINPNDEIGQLARTFNMTLDRLEDAFNRTRRFSTDVSHELRTPLTILRGETEVGLRWCGNPDEFKKILSSNMEEINRMSDIIGDLLDLSRAEEGRLGLELMPVDLNKLIEELLGQMGPRAEEKRITLTFTGGTAIVSGDQARLKQLFSHVIDNAVKFTPENGEIIIMLEDEADMGKLTVTDSGPGIPQNDLPHVFDQFYRVDQARNRNDGGSGLGLSLVRSIAEAHGGKVAVTCPPGQGCTFTVFLPTTPP